MSHERDTAPMLPVSRLSTIALVILLVCAATTAPAGEAVWIDTDPACSGEPHDDVDDCWAIAFALRSPELSVLGLSTVFGNVTEPQAWQHLGELSTAIRAESITGRMPPAYRGAPQPVSNLSDLLTDADRALASALESRSLTILALGPLTNIARLVRNRPELGSRIKRIIAIAGQRPGQWFFPGDSRILHFHDLNFRKDVDAFDIVLGKGIPVTLAPFELASKVVVTGTDLDRMTRSEGIAAWLAKRSRSWMRFWKNDLRAEGFFPFDSLAIGYLIMSSSFECTPMKARVIRRRSLVVTRHTLEVVKKDRSGHTVSYCTEVKDAFKNMLIERLTGPGQ